MTLCGFVYSFLVVLIYITPQTFTYLYIKIRCFFALNIWISVFLMKVNTVKAHMSHQILEVLFSFFESGIWVKTDCSFHMTLVLDLYTASVWLSYGLLNFIITVLFIPGKNIYMYCVFKLCIAPSFTITLVQYLYRERSGHCFIMSFICIWRNTPTYYNRCVAANFLSKWTTEMVLFSNFPNDMSSKWQIATRT